MKRETLAPLLVAAAIGIPSVAWWIAGTADVARTVAGIRDEPRELAALTAQRLARRLGVELEEIRAREGRRPSFHYQQLFHDPRGTAQGLALVPSPLVDDSLERLVGGRFQADRDGNITFLAGDGEALRRRLADDWNDLQSRIPALSEGDDELHGERIEVQAGVAWEQNQFANVLPERLDPARYRPRLRGEVEVVIGSMHFLRVGHPAGLFCLRRVRSPAGEFLQGFEIDLAELHADIDNSLLPARFEPGAPSGSHQARVRLGTEDWRVVVDTAPLASAIAERAESVPYRFRRTFATGFALALLVGALVVLQVRAAEQRAAERSRFAAAAAHELRTPLAALRMYSEMLADGLGDPSKATLYCRRIADESARLGRVVTNVLGFSRLERNSLSVHPAPGDLGATVAESVERSLPALASRGASIALALPPEPLRLPFDRDAVREIVENLLDNAEKYSRGAAQREIEVGVEGGAGQARIIVRDHGPGVEPKRAEKIFEPFVRSERSKEPPGLGLGLALVRALARAHGGDATYESASDGGARFVVRLPSA